MSSPPRGGEDPLRRRAGVQGDLTAIVHVKDDATAASRRELGGLSRSVLARHLNDRRARPRRISFRHETADEPLAWCNRNVQTARLAHSEGDRCVERQDRLHRESHSRIPMPAGKSGPKEGQQHAAYPDVSGLSRFRCLRAKSTVSSSFRTISLHGLAKMRSICLSISSRHSQEPRTSPGMSRRRMRPRE